MAAKNKGDGKSPSGKKADTGKAKILSLPSQGTEPIEFVIPLGRRIDQRREAYTQIMSDILESVAKDAGAEPFLSSQKKAWERGNLDKLNDEDFFELLRSTFRRLETLFGAEIIDQSVRNYNRIQTSKLGLVEPVQLSEKEIEIIYQNLLKNDIHEIKKEYVRAIKDNISGKEFGYIISPIILKYNSEIGVIQEIKILERVIRYCTEHFLE